MSQIISNPSAYAGVRQHKSPQIQHYELQCKAAEDERWLMRKMAEFAAEHNMPITLEQIHIPDPIPVSEPEPASPESAEIANNPKKPTLRRDSPYYGLPDGLKRCGRCRKVLPLRMFYRNLSTRDGLSYVCRQCSAQYMRDLRKARSAK